MKTYTRLLVTIIASLLLAASARANGDFGMGAGAPRDSVFKDGMLSVYADYIQPSERPVTWRAGLDWSYATRPFDGYQPDLTYTAFGGRAAALWFPAHGSAKRGGFYLGAGPSLLYYTLKRETPASGGGGIIYQGTGGISNLWALLLNQIGSNSYVPGKSVSDTKTAFGGHACAGYQGSFWHVEALYEAAAADLIKPGGIQVRFGFSF
jgi:hypothetical protein